MNTETLQDRLRYCVEQVGTQKELALKANLSRSQFMRYLDGESNPPVSKLIDISEASGVDLGWIVTGKGSPTSCNTVEPSLFTDYDLLSQVIKVFEEVLMEYPIQALTPSQKSQIIPLILAESQHRTRQGKSGEMPPQDVFDIMRYTSSMLKSNSLRFFKDLVLRASQSNIGLQEDLEVNNFVNVVNNAVVQYFDSPVSDYYERTKNALDINAKRSYMKVLETLFTYVKEPRIKMLDIGSGTGRYLLYVHETCERIEVKGIETSQKALEICQQFENTGKLPEGTVVLGNALEIPFKNAEFDFVTSQAVMHWIPFFKDKQFGAHKAFAEAHRVLKKGGAFYVDMLSGNGEQTLVPFTQSYSKEMLENLGAAHGFRTIWVHTNDNPYCEELIDFRKAGHPKFRNFIKAFFIKI